MLWASLLTLLLLQGCGRTDPEQKLRSRLQTMQQAAEDKRIGEFMESVAEDFTGNGGMDRAALHNLLRLQMLARSNLLIETGPVEVRLQGGNATLRFTALLAGGEGRLLPDTAQVYDIDTGWRLVGGNWQLYYAHWKPRL